MQALVLTQMVVTSSLVVSSSINSPRWLFTNLRHKDFNRPILSQTDNSFCFTTWQKERIKQRQSHTAAASLPPLHAFCQPYFTSAVTLFERTFFTFLKAHLHAQHTPGSLTQWDTNSGIKSFYTNLHWPWTGWIWKLPSLGIFNDITFENNNDKRCNHTPCQLPRRDPPDLPHCHQFWHLNVLPGQSKLRRQVDKG